ncbi:hypothetical protein Salat_1157900 [Sesamum alatum]|uniref:Myb/SANT-like domain-containing protein n=1 Tax=Sesamum alatum TaxID=300844 RepID=A0AAE1YEX1_9LAMI|nr:hypothetical protein Salat_1157900 [Sesamum alatum]
MDPVSPISSTQVPRSDKIVWSSFMEHRFIEFMHEEFISNRLQSSTFSPSVWTRICERMNASMYPSHVFTTDQLKGKLNRLRRAWRLMNDILNRGTGWGWDSERNTITDDAGRLDELYRENPELKKIIEHGLPHFDLCTQMFARNTAHGGIARSNANPPRAFNTGATADDDQMTAGSSGGRRSRDDYEDTAATQSSHIGSPPTYTVSAPSGSKRHSRRGASTLQSKKCETMDKLNESLQGKIDRAGPQATFEIERCVDELTKFQDLPDNIFTTALERFHNHNTRTIFLRLDDLNKLRCFTLWRAQAKKLSTVMTCPVELQGRQVHQAVTNLTCQRNSTFFGTSYVPSCFVIMCPVTLLPCKGKVGLPRLY